MVRVSYCLCSLSVFLTLSLFLSLPLSLSLSSSSSLSLPLPFSPFFFLLVIHFLKFNSLLFSALPLSIAFSFLPLPQAPENITDRKYGTKSDVWAYGTFLSL